MTTQRAPRNRLGRRLAALIAAGAAGAAVAIGTAAAVGAAGTTTVRQTVVSAQQTALASTLAASQIYAQDASGVVDIAVTTTATDPFGNTRSEQDEGSGFVVDEQGDIVTNEHVVDGATSIVVTFSDGTKAKATLVGSDASTDLAVIRVHVGASELTPLTLADSSTVEVGDPVVAIGSPFGYADSITSGIVSALGRDIEAPNGATIKGAVQTDAAINPGNSGGPLIDASGRVIGVNAQISSQSSGSAGVGFAIPSSTVKSVVTRILGGDL
jgi:S1-C subfamily serine protease